MQGRLLQRLTASRGQPSRSARSARSRSSTVVQALGEVVGQVALGQVLGLQHGLRPHRNGLPARPASALQEAQQALTSRIIATGNLLKHHHKLLPKVNHAFHEHAWCKLMTL